MNETPGACLLPPVPVTVLHHALDLCSDAVCICDADGQVQYTNPAFRALMGYDSAGLQAAGGLEALLVDATAAQTLRNALQSVKSWSGVVSLCAADGKSLSLHLNAGRAAPEDVRSETVYTLYPPHPAQAELALQQSKDFLQRVIDAVPGFVCIKNREGKFTLVNHALAEAYGTTVEDLVGKTDHDFNANRDEVEQFLRDDREVIASGKPKHIPEEKITFADGSQHWLSTIKTPLVDENNDCTSLLATTLDITELKRAEATLRAGEEKFRAIASYTADWESWVDPSGKLLWVNPAVEKITGYSVEECLAMPDYPAPIIYEEDRLRLWNFFTDAVRGGSGENLEFRVQRKDGGIVWCSVNWIPIYDADGNPIGHRSGVREITRHKQTEQRLAEALDFNQKIIDASSHGMVAFKIASGQCVLANEAAARLVNAPVETLLKQNYRDLLSWQKSGILALAEQVIADGQPRRGEFYQETAFGSAFWSDCYFTTFNSGGEPHLLLLFDDVSERKKTVELIRGDAARAEALARMAGRLNAEMDLKSVLNTVCEETAAALNVPVTSVMLFDEAEGSFTLGDTYGLPPDFFERYVMPAHAHFVQNIIQTESAVTIPDLQQEPGIQDIIPRSELELRSAVSVRLAREDHLIGTLNIITLDAARSFQDEELLLLRGLADEAAQAIANARLFEDVQRHLRQLEALREIDVAITGSVDLEIIFRVILDQAIDQLGIDAADILLLNPHAHLLDYVAGRGFRTRALRNTHLRLGQGHAGRAALERRMVSANLAQDRSWFDRSPQLFSEGFVSYYATPLVSKGQVKGVLEIFRRSPISPNQEWLDFLDALAGQAAIAVDNASLFNELQRSNIELVMAYDTTLEGWSRALDLRDKETEGHTQRVAELTVRLARMMQVSDKDLVHIRRGALLHDIGKMGIPDAILLKPGPLSEEEWVIMRRHPVYAFEMLSPIAFLREALDIPYCHHERWDGSGYPRGLKGEQIPLAARFFAIIDVWDALRSDRPYRQCWSSEKALEYIIRQSGVQFDPKVVEIFIELIQSEEFRSLYPADCD